MVKSLTNSEKVDTEGEKSGGETGRRLLLRGIK
jgi:hypothetical protein